MSEIFSNNNLHVVRFQKKISDSSFKWWIFRYIAPGNVHEIELKDLINCMTSKISFYII